MAESFFRLNFNVGSRERARAREKKKNNDNNNGDQIIKVREYSTYRFIFGLF